MSVWYVPVKQLDFYYLSTQLWIKQTSSNNYIANGLLTTVILYLPR